MRVGRADGLCERLWRTDRRKPIDFTQCTFRVESQQPILQQTMRTKRTNLRHEKWEDIVLIVPMHDERNQIQCPATDVDESVQSELALR